MSVAVLNIVTHPHSPAGYTELLRRAKDERIGGLVRGDRHATISSFSKTDTKDIEIWTGVLNSFVDFDPKAPWLNVERGEEADPDELASIQLPEDLKPDMKGAVFAFVPSLHRFIYQLVPGLNVHGVRRALQLILNNKKVRGTVTEVTVTIEQERESLDRIFGMQVLRQLRITVTRPNPDDFDDEDEEVEKRLERMKARKLTQTLDAERGQSLAPDEETKKLATSALSNGHVYGAGVGQNGLKQEVSTNAHPWILNTEYNPKTTLPDNAFLLAAKEVAHWLTARRRK